MQTFTRKDYDSIMEVVGHINNLNASGRGGEAVAVLDNMLAERGYSHRHYRAVTLAVARVAESKGADFRTYTPAEDEICGILETLNRR